MSGVADRLRALADAATPGPWCFHDSTDPRGHKGEFRAPSPHNGFMLVGPWTNDRDAPLMALAPELALVCADALDALAQMMDMYDRHAGWCGYNKDAFGDYIHNTATRATRDALASAARLFPEDAA